MTSTVMWIVLLMSRKPIYLTKYMCRSKKYYKNITIDWLSLTEDSIIDSFHYELATWSTACIDTSWQHCSKTELVPRQTYQDCHEVCLCNAVVNHKRYMHACNVLLNCTFYSYADIVITDSFIILTTMLMTRHCQYSWHVGIGLLRKQL